MPAVAEETRAAGGESASHPDTHIAEDLATHFGPECVTQECVDGIRTVWVPGKHIRQVMRYLKNDAPARFELMFDLSAIDERARQNRDGQPASEFTVFYHLMSLSSDDDVRIKVALADGESVDSIESVYPVANWYEREAFDMFGVEFDGHPNLRRILTPPLWEGHPLRKEHPARATEMDPFKMTPEFQKAQQDALRFAPEEWGMSLSAKHTDFMFLNLGPNHPSVHGVFRIALQLDGEVIVQAVPDIGYHHRAQEKMAERQSWHTYIPYTDRVDYLGGVMNNLPYVMNVEKMAGIEVPERAQVIRVMLAEFFRISSHLVFYGTFAQDVGQMSPVLYMFADRERLFSIRRGHHRRTHAPELVPHRRRHPGPAGRLGQDGAGLLRLHARAPRPLREDGDAQQDPAAPHQGHRRLHHGGRDSTGASPARRCAPRATTGTCARTARTACTTSSSSTSPPPKPATATPARR